MKQCKPCITIRAVFNLAKEHWTNFVKDVKSYSSINHVACELNNIPVVKPRPHKEVEKIRKLAQSNYIKDREGMFHFNDANTVENLVKEYKSNGSKAV